MKDLKWFYKKFGVAFVILLLVVVLVCIVYDRQNGDGKLRNMTIYSIAYALVPCQAPIRISG